MHRVNFAIQVSPMLTACCDVLDSMLATVVASSSAAQQPARNLQARVATGSRPLLSAWRERQGRFMNLTFGLQGGHGGFRLSPKRPTACICWGRTSKYRVARASLTGLEGLGHAASWCRRVWRSIVSNCRCYGSACGRRMSYSVSCVLPVGGPIGGLGPFAQSQCRACQARTKQGTAGSCFNWQGRRTCQARRTDVHLYSLRFLAAVLPSGEEHPG